MVSGSVSGFRASESGFVVQAKFYKPEPKMLEASTWIIRIIGVYRDDTGFRGIISNRREPSGQGN